MNSTPHSPGNPDDTIVPLKETRFYYNLRTADKRLTELLAGGHAFSKGGDELLPIGETQVVHTPFIQEDR